MPALYWCGDDGLAAPKLGVLGDEDSLLAEVVHVEMKHRFWTSRRKNTTRQAAALPLGLRPSITPAEVMHLCSGLSRWPFEPLTIGSESFTMLGQFLMETGEYRAQNDEFICTLQPWFVC